MTEKRFTIEIWQEGSLFYKDDKEGFSTHNSTSYVTNLVENKLNELYDENEQLKHDYGQLQYEMSQIIEKYNELEKENEIMLGGLTLYQEKSADLELRNIRQAEQLDELSEENEQLKKELYLIDKLIEDLGHEEMKRQYEEIINGDVE